MSPAEWNADDADNADKHGFNIRENLCYPRHQRSPPVIAYALLFCKK
jgi:hypothetical protein